MFEKQKQNVGENSTAIQAGGNITFTPYKELRAIFLDLFELNFPRIQQVAKEIADQRVEAMLDELRKSFVKHKDQIDPRKFEEPAMQYEMQAIAIDVARKGEKSNVDLLCELFCTMMHKDCPELIELIAAEAMRILPNLSPKHVGYLSLEVLVNEAVPTVKTLQTINDNVGRTLAHISKCEQVTQSDLQYISVSRAIVARGIAHVGVTPLLIKNIPKLKDKNPEQLIECFNQDGLHNLSKLQNLISNLHIGHFQLTAVGRLIGCLNLSKFSQIDIKQLFK